MDNTEVPRGEHGRLLPGHPGLKKKGSLSIYQRTTREKLWIFLETKLDKLDDIFTKLSDKEKARFLAHLLPFFLPKQSELTVDISTDPQVTIDYSRLSEGTLKEILNATKIENEEL